MNSMPRNSKCAAGCEAELSGFRARAIVLHSLLRNSLVLRGGEMKTSLKGVLILVALSVAFSCVAVGTAQRLGGYKEIAKDDPEAEAAAAFAIQAQNEKQGSHYKLVEI